MSLQQRTSHTDANTVDNAAPPLADALPDEAPSATLRDDEVALKTREEQVRAHLRRVESFFEEREFAEVCQELGEFAKRLLDSMHAFLDLNGNSIEAFQEIDKQTQTFLGLHKQIHRYRDVEVRSAAARQAAFESISRLPRKRESEEMRN